MSIRIFRLNSARGLRLWRRIGLAVAAWGVGFCAAAYAQDEARFVSGPLAWTPTFQLREVGVDSNVFNTPTDAKEDVVGTASSQVRSLLSLGVLQAATQGGVEYLYFERYQRERGINGRLSSDMQFPLSHFTPDVAVSWAHVKERSSSELDVRAPRTDWSYALGMKTALTSRIDVTVTGGKQTLTYDKDFAFRGVNVATQLNRETVTGMVLTRVTLTPFTSLLLDASMSRDDFPFRPSASTDNVRGNIGFEFAPDAVIHGRAMVGFHSLRPRYGEAADSIPAFDGITSSTEIGYTFLDVTRLTGRFARESNYSILTSEPLYVSTGGGLDVVQTLFGPVDLNLRASRERLGYVETAVAAGHRDVADTLGGGFSIRVGSEAVIALMYDNTERRSNAGRDFEYRRHRMYTTITYGF